MRVESFGDDSETRRSTRRALDRKIMIIVGATMHGKTIIYFRGWYTTRH